ncbi:MAG: hypothetical protein SNJ74_09780 [Fimbriimonadaceae bacterium]
MKGFLSVAAVSCGLIASSVPIGTARTEPLPAPLPPQVAGPPAYAFLLTQKFFDPESGALDHEFVFRREVRHVPTPRGAAQPSAQREIRHVLVSMKMDGQPLPVGKDIRPEIWRTDGWPSGEIVRPSGDLERDEARIEQILRVPVVPTSSVYVRGAGGNVAVGRHSAQGRSVDGRPGWTVAAETSRVAGDGSGEGHRPPPRSVFRVVWTFAEVETDHPIRANMTAYLDGDGRPILIVGTAENAPIPGSEGQPMRLEIRVERV